MRANSRPGRSWRPGLVGLWLVAEALLGLCQMYTEPTYAFDWDAYMEQVERFVPSHRNGRAWTWDYTALRGDTGPLVYPSGHLLLHTAMHALTQWNSTAWTTESLPKNIS